MEVNDELFSRGWRWQPVKDLCEFVSVGYVSSTRNFFCPPGEGVRLVRSQNIRPGRLTLEETAWVTGSFHNSNRKSQLRAGDVLFTRVGANAGDVCIVPDDAGELHLSSAVFARPLREHRKYIELFFRSLLGQQLLKSRIVGSVSARINTRDVEALQVLVPSAGEESAIASILGALDDKIELNRKMSATLEAMTRAIFKSWFVNFDPVRAKAEGRDTGLAPEIDALFPASLIGSPVGSMPSDWRVARLSDLLELSYGKPLKAEDRRSGGYAVYGSNGQVGVHDELLVDGPGIIVGRKGNPGTVAWCSDPFWPIDTTFYVQTALDSSYFYYFHYALQHLDLPHLSSDSAVPGLNRVQAGMSNLICPPENVVSSFANLVIPLYKRSELAIKESRTLTAIRDALLPKLISGELRVSEADRILEMSA